VLFKHCKMSTRANGQPFSSRKGKNKSDDGASPNIFLRFVVRHTAPSKSIRQDTIGRPKHEQKPADCFKYPHNATPTETKEKSYTESDATIDGPQSNAMNRWCYPLALTS